MQTPKKVIQPDTCAESQGGTQPKANLRMIRSWDAQDDVKVQDLRFELWGATHSVIFAAIFVDANIQL